MKKPIIVSLVNVSDDHIVDTDRQESKMTMKLKIDNGLQDWKTEHREVAKTSRDGRFRSIFETRQTRLHL